MTAPDLKFLSIGRALNRLRFVNEHSAKIAFQLFPVLAFITERSEKSSFQSAHRMRVREQVVAYLLRWYDRLVSARELYHVLNHALTVYLTRHRRKPG